MKNQSNIKLGIIVTAGVISFIFLIIFGMFSCKNKAYVLEEQVESAESDIQIQEKRRVDLVYNLADCVKNYDKYEYDTLTSIVDGRSNGDVTSTINAIVEAYPELKSNENYQRLMTELSLTENLIAEYRENYNKQIKSYKKYVRKTHISIILNILGYEVQEYKYLDYDAPSDAPQNLFGE